MTIKHTKEVRPFRIEISPEQSKDLKHRIANTRWPEQLPGEVQEAGLSIGRQSLDLNACPTTKRLQAAVHVVEGRCAHSVFWVP